MNNTLDVAVIGMSGRFPGAENINKFWQNLRDGVESISFLTDEELAASGVSEDLFKNPNYVKAAAAHRPRYLRLGLFPYALPLDPTVRHCD